MHEKWERHGCDRGSRGAFASDWGLVKEWIGGEHDVSKADVAKFSENLDRNILEHHLEGGHGREEVLVVRYPI
jgi:hypothetical protein